MGEMADFLLGQIEYDIFGDEWIEYDCLAEYFDLPIETLVAQTSRARHEKIKGIRRHYAQFNRLSDKQKWCLCFWLAAHDHD